MIDYICTECNKQFQSDKETKDRGCPHCGSSGEDHAMLSLSQPEDFATIVADGE